MIGEELVNRQPAEVDVLAEDHLGLLSKNAKLCEEAHVEYREPARPPIGSAVVLGAARARWSTSVALVELGLGWISKHGRVLVSTEVEAPPPPAAATLSAP